MEGRRPPPRAEHPYPNKPDFTKFWGTKNASGLFKLSGSAILVIGALIGLRVFTTRDQPTFLDFLMQSQRVEARLAATDRTRFFLPRPLPLVSPMELPDIEMKTALDTRLFMMTPDGSRSEVDRGVESQRMGDTNK